MTTLERPEDHFTKNYYSLTKMFPTNKHPNFESEISLPVLIRYLIGMKLDYSKTDLNTLMFPVQSWKRKERMKYLIWMTYLSIINFSARLFVKQVLEFTNVFIYWNPHCAPVSVGIIRTIPSHRSLCVHGQRTSAEYACVGCRRVVLKSPKIRISYKDSW